MVFQKPHESPNLGTPYSIRASQSRFGMLVSNSVVTMNGQLRVLEAVFSAEIGMRFAYFSDRRKNGTSRPRDWEFRMRIPGAPASVVL